jgi:glycosyltransferase involved in cell wall biosynthesis
MSLKISVIVSTYNWPRALNIALDCLCRQNDSNYEIIVADDGSKTETKDLVKKYQKKFVGKKTIKYVWQEDRGFRLARIRNLAVKAASGEYLVFIDGDCLAPPTYLQKHRKLMEKGWMIRGQRILTSKDFTNKILEGDIDYKNNKFWTFEDIFYNKIKGNFNRFSPALEIPILWMRKIAPKHWGSVRGCNMAIWKEDYIKINGSDEYFEGWGAEDSDLSVRLVNSGVRIKNGDFCSYVIHLWHKNSDRIKTDEKMRIVLKRAKEKIVFPTKGIN